MKKFVFAVVFSLALCFTAFGQPSTIQQYLNIKSAGSPTFSPDAKHIVYLTNVTGTSQVWSIDLPNGQPKQLTNYDDNISFVRWLPDGGGIIFGKARGGDENTQLFWMKTDGSGLRQLTDDPKVQHNFAEISDDGRTIYYSSNKRNRNFFDIYSMDLSTGSEDLIYQQDGNNDLAAVNDNGTKFIISRDGVDLSLDNNLYLVDAKTKQETLLTPHTGASQFGDVEFVADGIIFAHNNGREFYSLAQMRKKNAAGDDWSDANREVKILDNVTPWDIGGLTMTPNGNTLAYTVNREGFSELELRRVETGGKPRISTVAIRPERIQLPAQGVAGGVTLSNDQQKVAFSFSSATNNGDIWVFDRRMHKLDQITHSDRAGIDQISFVAPELIKYKTFDGRDVPAWYYRPLTNAPSSEHNFIPGYGKVSANRNLPVIVSVHGGPEGQERSGFNPLYQYYLSHGYAILATNVRGSTGYGKTFTHLDDVRKREDSVKDLAYAVEWLKAKGAADPKRIAVMGGSYGGYMTLAAITLYPDLWAAAVDTVGIANWESFLKNTSGYRRRQREVEYGMLDKDIDFLRSISPLSKVDKIKTPLFIIAGKNDPRVPYTEAEQMVGALKKRGAVVEYKLYDDEGHGIAKLKNRLELYPLVADFLDKYMK
ncbi:MAG: S9 family peptidase [Pyrinomonadaceae bacterium]